MRAHELLDDGQADPGAAGRARARWLAAPEAVEHPSEVAGRDADAGVRDFEQRVRSLAPHAQGDGAARVGVAQGVREQVVHDLLEPPGVACDRDRLELALEHDSLAREVVVVAVGPAGGHPGEVELRLFDEQRRLFRLGEALDVLDQAAEPERLDVHRREVCRRRSGGRRPGPPRSERRSP